MYNGASNYVPALVSFIVSAFVVNFYSEALWGSFITVIININLFNHVLFWGHRVPMIREISKEPSQVYLIWFSWLWTRFLLLAIPVTYFFLFEDDLILYMILLQVLIFVQSSFQTLVIYLGRFKKYLFIEVASLIAYVSYIIFHLDDLTLLILIQGYCIFYLVRCFGVYMIVKNCLDRLVIKIDFHRLKEGLPFFLLLLAGFFSTRLDLFYIREYSNEVILGQYHIITNFLIQSAAISGLILVPLSKYLYRLPKRSYKKLLFNMSKIGVLGAVCMCALLPFFLHFLYSIDTSLVMLVSFFLFVSVPIIISPIVMYFYSINREDLVLKFSLFSVTIHLIVLIALPMHPSLETILLYIGFTKLVVLAGYFLLFLLSERRNNVLKTSN